MRRGVPYILFITVYGALFILRVMWQQQAEAKETLPLYVGETTSVVGVVTNDPEYRATSLHANIAVSHVGEQEARGTMLAILPRTVELAYGDTVSIAGKISLPESFETDTGREFDYAGYLRVQGVSAMMARATLDSREEGGVSPSKLLFSIKHVFERSLEKLFPEPDSSLLEGILLGERRGLPKDVNDAFITSGLIHVVVLSGYNISIVSESMLRATSFLPKTFNYGVGGVLMILFAMMSGGGAATVRACVMGLIAILARYLKRPADALRALIVAALGMALWNPHVVVHDPSFILSVLATFGLITLSPTVETYLQWIPEKVGLRSIAASTLSVQIFVLPALLYMTGIFSFLSLPANVLALPVVPMAMFMGFVAGVAGLLSPVIAFPFAYIADALLRWMMLVAHTVHILPFSSTVVTTFPFWIVAVVYAPLTALAIWTYQKNASRSQTN